MTDMDEQEVRSIIEHARSIGPKPCRNAVRPAYGGWE